MDCYDLEEMLLDNSVWTREEDLIFEKALAELGSDHSSPFFFERIASRLPWKSIESIRKHYQDLIDDVEMIEANLIEPPKYKDDVEDDIVNECNSSKTSDNDKIKNENENENKTQKDNENESSFVAKTTGFPTQSTQQKKRGVPWTEEEHRRFLMGLNKFGKGDWRSISRFYVETKTPTQVASHAQKYFRRQKNSTPPARRRPSIHDIQSVNSNIVSFHPRHMNPPQPPLSPPVFALPNYTLPPPLPTIYPTYPQTYNVGEMPTTFPSSGPAFLPETTTFPVTMMPTMDPLLHIAYPSPYLFPSSKQGLTGW